MTTSGPSLFTALMESIEDMPMETCDEAALVLAKRFAKAIDARPGELKDLGPKFLACLTALRLTPASRNAPQQETPDDAHPTGPAATLFRLRAVAQAARNDGAASVDEAAS